MMTVARIVPPRLTRALEILRQKIKDARNAIGQVREDIEELEVLMSAARQAGSPRVAVATLHEELVGLKEELAAGLRLALYYDDIALMLAQEAGMTMAELQEQWERQDQE